MNIKKSIKSIMEKYCLYISGKLYETNIIEEIVKILNNIPENKTIAIRGAGYHTEKLLSIEGCTAQFKYIFDYSKKEKEIVEIAGKEREIYPCSIIDSVDFDIIIISSYTHRKRIREELEKSQRQFEILDLYDELHKSGLDVNAPFYFNTSGTYEYVLYYRKKYIKNENAVNLKNLIVAYLGIYDFINFEKFAREYINKKYPDYNNVYMALNEILSLLSSVKEKLKQRTKKDIITVWNDQLDYNWLKYTSYMQKVSENSMFFENAYTMAPFTVSVLLGIFQGLKPIDDGIYHEEFPHIDNCNSNIIKELELSGYTFLYIGDYADSGLFNEKYVIGHYTYNSSCIGCIDLIQELLNEEKPVCVILHALVETHNPYLSGGSDEAEYYEWPLFGGKSEKDALKQRKKSVAYWDEQLGFYMDFISDNCIKIFMSDHGARYNIQPIYKEQTTHIIFFITGDGVPNGKYNGMFSIYDFYKVIHCILKNNYDEKIIFSDYVLIQETSVFNKTTIRYYIKNNATDCLYGFRAVRTERELYVKLESGKKYYYLLPDEETDCINKADKERLEWLDALAGDKFEKLDGFEKEIENFQEQFDTHE